MVKAIESQFVPLLIYNNKDKDAPLLKRYQEPSWNFPVVRFLNHKGRDLIPRKDRVYTRKALTKRMEAALQKAKAVP